MPIELLAGESKELNVAMQPIGDGQSVPIMQYIYMVDVREGAPSDDADCVAFCPVKNIGTAAGTHEVTIFALLYDVFEEPQLKSRTRTLTIQPGETALFDYPFDWVQGARGEIWAVGDWGETTPKLFCTFGYRYMVPDSGQVVCTRAGADHATFKYSQYSICNTWQFSCHTPPLVKPWDQYIKWNISVVGHYISGYWHCIHTLAWGLLSGRTYEVHGSGGPSWQEDWAQFTTP